MTRNETDQSRVVTSPGNPRDAKAEGGKAILRKTSPSKFPFFFSFTSHFLPRHSVRESGPDPKERGWRNTQGIGHYIRIHGRRLPETDWRDLGQLPVPDSRNRPRGNSNIFLSLSLARCLTVSLLPSPLSLYPIRPSPYFISIRCLRLSSLPSSPTTRRLLPLHPPRTPPMDNSHDYPSLSNSCIPNVGPPGTDPSLVDFREFYPYIPNEIKHRKRTTQAQLEILEQTFAHDKKPNGVMRANLAKQLDMTPRGVQVSPLIFIFHTFPDASIVVDSQQVWFQNRYAPTSYPLISLDQS